MSVIDEFFNLDVSQFIKWCNYIFDDLKNKGISYYTLHGSKGLEFDNVVVVLQDKFAKKIDYCKYFLKIIILQLLRIIDFKKFVIYFM